MDLLRVYAVSAVATQGAVTEDSWVSSYLVGYRSNLPSSYLYSDGGGKRSPKVCFSTVHTLQKLQ